MSRSGPVHLLVDGHNVLYQDPVLARLMANPEQARGELERLLAGRPRITLFYDGGPGGVAGDARRLGLAIDYSGPAPADDRIVRWLLFHPNVRAALVSDDRELRRRVRTLGASAIDAHGFLASFRASDRAGAKPGGDQPLSPAEVDEWMRIFGIDDAKE